MEDHNMKDYDWSRNHTHNNRLGRIVGGIALVTAGVLLIMQKLGYNIPGWIFSWEMILITIGIIIGAKHGFRGFGWLIPITIGGIFLIDNIFPNTPLKPFIIPAVAIAIGLFLIFKPKRKGPGYCESYKDRSMYPGRESNEDFIDTTVVFGGVDKTIISKTFKGGDIVCVFGGGEINLSQADIEGSVTLDATLIFGGAKIIIPSHWQVKPEMTAILGGIEDKRVNTNNYDPNKILVLRGTTIFGGLEIKNY